MTINDFDKLIVQATSAFYDNTDPRTALIYLHKILNLMEDAAWCALCFSTIENHRSTLSGTMSEAHERKAQVLGFIQELVREEDRGK